MVNKFVQGRIVKTVPLAKYPVLQNPDIRLQPSLMKANEHERQFLMAKEAKGKARHSLRRIFIRRHLHVLGFHRAVPVFG